jgi:hypothetical protein
MGLCNRHCAASDGPAVVGWSGADGGGPGRVSGGCGAYGVTDRRGPGARTRVPPCRSSHLDRQEASESARAYQLTRHSGRLVKPHPFRLGAFDGAQDGAGPAIDAPPYVGTSYDCLRGDHRRPNISVNSCHKAARW